MIQPVPKSNKEQKHISTSKPGNNIASSIYKVPPLVQIANWV
jgi:hypothetical protein